MSQIEKALKLAYEKHNGQLDKGGNPYVLHPITVALTSTINYVEEGVCVALLHDIVEDTDVTFEDLKELGFNDVVIKNLKLLTRKDNENYFDYIKNIRDSGEYIAYCTKVADLEHNMDLSRLKEVTDKDIKRKEKYQKALNILYRNE